MIQLQRGRHGCRWNQCAFGYFILISVCSFRVLSRKEAVFRCPSSNAGTSIWAAWVCCFADLIAQPAIPALWCFRIAFYLALATLITGEAEADALRWRISRSMSCGCGGMTSLGRAGIASRATGRDDATHDASYRGSLAISGLSHRVRKGQRHIASDATAEDVDMLGGFGSFYGDHPWGTRCGEVEAWGTSLGRPHGATDERHLIVMSAVQLETIWRGTDIPERTTFRICTMSV